MANPNPNLENLTHVLTEKDARKGGINSGKVRQEKSRMKKILEECLKMKSDSKEFKDLPYEISTTIGLLKGSEKGNSQNYKAIVEMLGELEAKQETNITPNIEIKVVDNSNLEEEMYK